MIYVLVAAVWLWIAGLCLAAQSALITPPPPRPVSDRRIFRLVKGGPR